MRLLFCCEYYHPSRGGVQEVMRQIAERLVAEGHEVTVATTRLAERDTTVLNGVRIEEFQISGSKASGLTGEVWRYRDFLTRFTGDAILIKAAQQWTFDAAWAVLDDIRARKVFIPCGFSGLYLPPFEAYFRDLPNVLRKFDHLVFYAERYRDIDFARDHGLANLTIVPNGASETEFAAEPDPEFRASQGIPEDDFLILTVGSPIDAKGHAEVAAAFAHLDAGEHSLSLVLDGDWSAPGPSARPRGPLATVEAFAARAAALWRRDGLAGFMRSLSYRLARVLKSASNRAKRGGGWLAYWAGAALHTIAPRMLTKAPARPRPETIDGWIAAASAQPGKRVFKTHLPRAETVQAFLAADLFVLASQIEYSPLVLFEAAAAGTPFLAVPAGNAEEIVRWTRGGVICPADRDELGITRVDPLVLAEQMQRLIEDPDLRRRLGEAGHDAWRREYTWAAISKRYEAILSGKAIEALPASRDVPLSDQGAGANHDRGD